MSDIVIKAENLGKRYTIGHQRGRGEQTTFREVLVQNARNLWNKSRDLFAGKPVIAGDTLEEVWALKDVSFEIKRGEAVGIIGRNGAGKSTLLKILSRITEPTTGRVTIKGRVASLLEVGTGFHSELTGRENIYLNGTILGMTRAEIKKKFDEIVAFSEVERYLDTPVKRYSSGMYVRLAFAVAAHLEPEILVIDEVLAVGDMQFQKKCLGKMGDVRHDGRTVLFVSHNMASIKVLCSSGILFENGQIINCNSANDCINTYLTMGLGSGSIVSNIEIQDPMVTVYSIHVNGSEHDSITLSPDCFVLDIEITGELKDSIPIELELQIKDLYEIPLAFFSPGHEKGEASILKSGLFRIVHSIALPRICAGHYLVDIFLTHPGIKYWVKIPRAFSLHVEGTATKSGLIIDYKGGVGFITLSSNSKNGQ